MQITASNLLPGSPASLPPVIGDPAFSSAFDVDTVAEESVRLAVGEIAAFGQSRGLDPEMDPIRRSRIGATFAGHLEVDGAAPPKWADLSGYYRTADDRFIQFHANFPHHAAGIVARLGGKADRPAIEREVLRWTADDLETALVGDGMITAKLRTLDEWATHPHAVATADLPLLEVRQIGEAAPRHRSSTVGGAMDGVRALDCSRVLAGPTAAQTWAAHGADVLRIGSSDLPAVPVCVMSTGFGKRNAHLDLKVPGDRDGFASLLSAADLWSDAYRPGAFDGFGFSPERAAELSPGIVVVQLCAFDWVGPWAGRRGFDSIVQSTTGIPVAGAQMLGKSDPTPLPVQALDYATGFLAAAAGAHMLRHQAEVGGSWLVRLSLLRTRNWLVGLGGPTSFEPRAIRYSEADLDETASDFGVIRAAKPLSGTWTTPPAPLHTSPPTWNEI